MKNIAWAFLMGVAMMALAALIGKAIQSSAKEEAAGQVHLRLMEAADVSVDELRQVNVALREIAKLLQAQQGEQGRNAAELARVLVSIEERIAQDAIGETPSAPAEAGRAAAEVAALPAVAESESANQSPGFIDPSALPGIEGEGTDALQTEEDGPVYAIEQGGRFGAAVAIGPKHLLTARHLGIGRGRVRVGQTWYWADIAAVPDGRDMSIVTFRGSPRLRGVEIGTAVEGQPVQFFSFNEKRLMRGTLHSRSLPGSRGRLGELYVDPQFRGIYPGDSGSAIFDSQGRLIGIASGYVGQHRRVRYVPLQGVALPNVQYDSQTEGMSQVVSAKPVLTVYDADFPCPPCERLKQAVKAGLFADFEVRFARASPEITRFPAIRYTDSQGVSRLLYGYDSNTIPFLKANAR